MMGKVLIEKVPYIRDIPGAKRWEEERGEFVQISYQEEIWHLAVFGIRKGFSRGNHYHEAKEEIFYVVSGKMRALFLDMDTPQKEEYILEKGDKIRIKPRCSHVFYGLEDTLVVEYSPQVYNREDSYRIDLEKEIMVRPEGAPQAPPCLPAGRQVGGVKEHNLNDNTLPGSPALRAGSFIKRVAGQKP